MGSGIAGDAPTAKDYFAVEELAPFGPNDAKDHLPLLILPASRNVVGTTLPSTKELSYTKFKQSMQNTVDKISVVNLGTESNHKSPLSNFNSCDFATKYDFLQQT